MKTKTKTRRPRYRDGVRLVGITRMARDIGCSTTHLRQVLQGNRIPSMDLEDRINAWQAVHGELQRVKPQPRELRRAGARRRRPA